MPEVRPSMQDLIRDRRRSGFVGRQREIAAFRDNFRCPPEDPAHRFLFHIHGVAGVGKTSLLRRLLQLAGEQGALTAQVDEAAGSVPEAMEALSAQLARQGHPLKSFDRLLQRYRQRRHEADSVVAAFDGAPALQAAAPPAAAPPGVPHPAAPADAPAPVAPAGAPAPSPAAGIAAQAGLAGLGLVPGLGAVAGAMDPQQVAQSLDRWRAALSTRLRSHDDVQLVLSPLQALTPAFLDDLRGVATAVPWIALFFDTYERTGPVLDAWLYDVMTSDRYGALPANVVVTRAGQQRLDPARWPAGGFAAELELEVFTEDEARGLIAAKGVADAGVVDEILHLSGRLPVLTSMLAEAPPAGPGGGGDPSGTAVERFLKWVADPVQRSAALAAALPPALDEDVFRVAAGPAAGGLYGWLCGLPFVSDEAGRVQYHGVVRSAMLRVQRTRSPQRWREQHRALAAAHAGWCAELAASLPPGTDPEDRWLDERWFGHRRNETYHLLCADPQGALPRARRDALQAADVGPAGARRWARTLEQAGADADCEPVRDWGRRLLAALGEEARTVEVCTFLLREAELTEPERVLAYTLRGRELRKRDEFDRSVADFNRALAIDPGFTRAYAGRGQAYTYLDRFLEAEADFTHCVEHDPDRAWSLTHRGRARLYQERFDDAKADLDQAIELEPSPMTWALRGEAHRLTGVLEQALADFDRAIEAADGDYAYAVASRAQCHDQLGRPEEALADLDRALQLDPQWAWCWVERGRLHQEADRYEAAVADYARALELAPAYDRAYANRGYCHRQLERLDEALADLDRALEIDPQWAWYWATRGEVHRLAGRTEQALADFDRAVELEDDYAWALASRGQSLVELRRVDEALAAYTRALEADPRLVYVLSMRARLYRVADRFDESLADYDRALEIDGTLDWLRLGRAHTLSETGRIAEAHAEVDVCLDGSPDDAEALHVRGRLFCLEERWEEALAVLARALAADPGHESAHYHRGETLMVLGRYEEAAPHVAAALAADPADGFNQFADVLLARLTRGPQSAGRWAAAEAAMLADSVTDADRAATRLVCRTAAGDWPAAAAALAALGSAAPYWLLLREVRALLGLLAAAPDAAAADRARIEGYLRVIGDLLRELPRA